MMDILSIVSPSRFVVEWFVLGVNYMQTFHFLTDSGVLGHAGMIYRIFVPTVVFLTLFFFLFFRMGFLFLSLINYPYGGVFNAILLWAFTASNVLRAW